MTIFAPLNRPGVWELNLIKQIKPKLWSCGAMKVNVSLQVTLGCDSFWCFMQLKTFNLIVYYGCDGSYMEVYVAIEQL